MPDYRVHTTETTETPAQLTLTPAESHHLVTVNRAPKNAPIIAFNGQGLEYDCTLQTPSKTAAILAVQSTRHHQRPSVSITLVQAIPQGGTIDDIIQKATELGASTIIPLITTRTQTKIPPDRLPNKLQKWNTIALEAAKQCGTPFLPQITAPISFPQLLNPSQIPSTQPTLYPLLTTLVQPHTLKLIATLLPNTKPLKTILHYHLTPQTKNIRILIGPEGDFTPEEIAATQQHHYHPLSLGPLTLRCETAAIASLSLLSHHLI